MKQCTKCGRECADDAATCLNCGARLANFAVADQICVGRCVLAALIPLFGFIYWPLKHKETPRRARACGITAIVSWAVSFLFGFVIGFLGAL